MTKEVPADRELKAPMLVLVGVVGFKRVGQQFYMAQILNSLLSFAPGGFIYRDAGHHLAPHAGIAFGE